MKTLHKKMEYLAALMCIVLISKSVTAEEGHEEEGVHIPAEVVSEFGIELASAAPGLIQTELSVTGEISLIPSNVVHVSPPIAGIVTNVTKSLGDNVAPGDVLATLKSRELATARAELLAARSRAKLARSTFAREKDLYEKKISSESDFLTAEQGSAAARIEVETARHRLLALGVSDGADENHDSLTAYTLEAPALGVITEKHITKGELVGPESRTFVIADISKVWVELTIYQKDLNRVRNGLEVSIIVADSAQKANGLIEFISPIIDPQTRSTTARVIIDNPNKDWKPGMFVGAVISLTSNQASVVIPKSALHNVDGETIVFIHEEGAFQVREIETGESESTNIEVISGIDAGERVASTNSFTLKAELEKSEFGEGHGH